MYGYRSSAHSCGLVSFMGKGPSCCALLKGENLTGTLWAMLITWLASGRPHYVSQDGNIAYISDVGADILKPLFVVGCVITGLSFFLSSAIERMLRHQGR